MNFSKLSLRTKITLFSVTFASVIVLGVGAYAYYALENLGTVSDEIRSFILSSLAVSGLISVFMSGVLGYFFAKYLSKPIKQMIWASNRVAEGHYDVHVKFNRGKEADQIAASFNTMVEKLKDHEVEVDSISKNLQLKVEQRTAELREKDKAVFHSSKLASIGQLASGVAHEINNPLQIITGNTELIESFIEDDEPDLDFVKGRIESIQESVGRIGRIVNGLRVYARTDDDDNPVIFDSEKLIENCVKLVSNIYKSDGIQLEMDFSAKRTTLLGSEGKFQQVIMNLFSNAKDAMEPKGGGLIKVSTANEMGQLIVRVSDNGEGISEENKDKIFDQFFTTKAVGKGTGLGMGIIHGIVTSMEGKVKLDSELGEGTTFTLDFPITEGEEQSLEHEEVELSPLQGRVLVVDDEESIRNVLSFQLREFGLEVDTAANGVEALMLIRSGTYDVLVTDMTMPIMNGEALINSVHEINYPVKIFLITGEIGFDGNKSPEEWEKEVDGFLPKPFRREYMHSLLKLHLEGADEEKKAA